MRYLKYGIRFTRDRRRLNALTKTTNIFVVNITFHRFVRTLSSLQLPFFSSSRIVLARGDKFLSRLLRTLSLSVPVLGKYQLQKRSYVFIRPREHESAIKERTLRYSSFFQSQPRCFRIKRKLFKVETLSSAVRNCRIQRPRLFHSSREEFSRMKKARFLTCLGAINSLLTTGRFFFQNFIRFSRAVSRPSFVQVETFWFRFPLKGN